MSRRRPAVIAGVAATWIAAIVIASAPVTTAVPASAPTVLADAAFAPVTVPRVLSTAPVPAPVAPAASPGPYAEGSAPPPPGTRPRVRQPLPAVGVVRKAPPPPPRPVTRHSVRGKASWYCKAGASICMAAHPDRAGIADLYAAAGPGLRRAICGSDTSNCWRGRRVVVNGLTVVLADWCQCYKGQSGEKLIDLYWDAWVRVPGVERGVTIRW